MRPVEGARTGHAPGFPALPLAPAGWPGGCSIRIRRVPREGAPMTDAILVLATIALTGLSILYVAGCDRL